MASTVGPDKHKQLINAWKLSRLFDWLHGHPDSGSFLYGVLIFLWRKGDRVVTGEGVCHIMWNGGEHWG